MAIGRRSRRGRKRGKRNPLAVIVVLLVFGAGGYFLWSFFAGDEPAVGDEPPAVAGGGANGSGPLALNTTPKAPPLDPAPTPKPGPTGAVPTPAPTPKPVAPKPAPRPTAPKQTDATTAKRLHAGLKMLAEGQLVNGRAQLNAALVSGKLSPADAMRARQEITKANQVLIFSPRMVKDDPWISVHRVKAGENLGVAIRKNNGVWWEFVSKINKVKDTSLRPNQPLKVLKGPFHAIANKRSFRLDIYLGKSPDDPGRMYVGSYPCGLGEDDSTPLGLFVVKNRQFNPPWTNPRTGKHYFADDPNNPIGDHWVGLTGLGEAAAFSGYGIHGTNDPDSIGRQRSMGCVRMRADDVAMVYSMMMPKLSHLRIVE